MYFTIAEFHSDLIGKSIIEVIALTSSSSSVDVIANVIQSSLFLSTEMRLFGNVMANGLVRWSRGWKIIDFPPLGGHYLKLSIEVMVPDIRRLMEKSESIFANHSRASTATATQEQASTWSILAFNVLELNNLLSINRLQSKVCFFQFLKGEKKTSYTRCQLKSICKTIRFFIF